MKLKARFEKVSIVLISSTVVFLLWRSFVKKTPEIILPDWEQDEIDFHTLSSRGDKLIIFEKWKRCAESYWMTGKDHLEFWRSFTEVSDQCEKEAGVGGMGVVTIRNKDDRKHFIFPRNYNNSTNLVTIGIGEDISAELHFQRKLKKLGKSINFFGADPMTSINPKLYSRIGKYFPYAVSMRNGVSKASVLIDDEYVERSVEHKNILEFVKEDLKMKVIDNLWLDAEFAEYELFPIFYNLGIFESNQILVCQVNMEVHLNQFENLGQNPTFQYKFMEFVRKIVADGKWGIFKSTEALHLRIFMFNFESDYCRRKF